MTLPAIPSWAGLAWKLLPWGGCLGLGITLALTIAGHRVERANWDRDKAKSEASAAKSEAANANRVIAATNTHTETTTRMQPIILNSKADVDAYAKTDAGRAPCLGADRVQSILARREQLFTFTPARRAEPVPASPALPYDPVER
jgi:hypothetical protein